MTTIALIDDHALIRNALKELINRFTDFEVIIDVANGQELVESLQQTTQPPDIALIDINMPIMDGFATAAYLRVNYPSIKMLALTVNNDDESVIKMLGLGAVGYLLKDTETDDLQEALIALTTDGYYHNELIHNSLLRAVKPAPTRVSIPVFVLQGREEEFLKLACTELTYKEIADRMCLSPRTIDGYRDALFEKLGLRSRVELALFAIKNGIFRI
jgi:two-component system, NarL family, invasion response regulator UvrY